jgi:type IV pilus assembly protein PilA
VIIIIGILLAIAVPSYLGFRDRAANNAAKANLRAALPAAEAYYSDNGTYVGMTPAALALVDSGVSPSLTVPTAAAASYCLTDIVSGKTWSVLGPGPSSADFKNNATCA